MNSNNDVNKQNAGESNIEIDNLNENNEEMLDDKQINKDIDSDLTDELAKLKVDYKDLNDKYLRCLAEYDNFRKRTTKEKERIFSDAVAYSVKEFLDILDNFERALKCETNDLEMKKGFDMIFNQLLNSIKKLGVEEIETKDLVFDPSFHNAVLHVEDDKYGKNQIIETLQKGYKLGDNIIRYAMVKVAN